MDTPRIHSLMAEFDNAGDLLAATRKAYSEGYRRMEAYSPMPVHGLADALGFRTSALPKLVLAGGILGCICGFLMQWVVETIVYPLNIGGRPFNSWPAFIPITFEVTVLFAAVTAVLGMLALNGLPRPHHPVFNVDRFALAGRDRFFLSIQSRDPKFDLAVTRAFLESTHTKGVYDVEG